MDGGLYTNPLLAQLFKWLRALGSRFGAVKLARQR
jgi:hypothetical protein